MRIIALSPASDARLAVQAEAAYGKIESWDTSGVDDMSQLFKDRRDFNEDVVSWAISYVGIM